MLLNRRVIASLSVCGNGIRSGRIDSGNRYRSWNKGVLKNLPECAQLFPWDYVPTGSWQWRTEGHADTYVPLRLRLTEERLSPLSPAKGHAWTLRVDRRMNNIKSVQYIGIGVYREAVSVETRVIVTGFVRKGRKTVQTDGIQVGK